MNDRLEIIKKEKQDSQTILFIHGTSLGSWCWEEYFVPFFQKRGYGTCTFSIRGHGNSWGKDDINKFGLNDYVEDCLNVIRLLENRPIIIAHSVGCLVLLKLLYNFSVVADKIILLAPVTYTGMLGEYFKFFFKYIRYHGLPGIYFSKRIDTEKMNFYKNKFSEVSSRVSLQLLKPIKMPDSIKGEDILVIGSHDDMGVSELCVYKVGKKLKAKTIFFPDMCHMLMLDTEWNKIAEEILGFLRKSC